MADRAHPMASLAIGAELRGPARAMTRERMRWYVDCQPTVAHDDGRIHTQPPTIHDDDDYARSQGLPGIISDGMITTNWILGLFYDAFGPAIARRGRLRTKYIAPVYEDEVIRPVACLTARADDGDGATRLAFDVWCEDPAGRKVTVGEAVVVLPPTGAG